MGGPAAVDVQRRARDKAGLLAGEEDGGVEALTRAAAKELAPDARVNAVAPGFVITPQNEETYAPGTEKRRRIDERTPMGRVAEREEIVGAAIYLASDAASFTTGDVVTVDGGFADSAL